MKNLPLLFLGAFCLLLTALMMNQSFKMDALSDQNARQHEVIEETTDALKAEHWEARLSRMRALRIEELEAILPAPGHVRIHPDVQTSLWADVVLINNPDKAFDALPRVRLKK